MFKLQLFQGSVEHGHAHIASRNLSAEFLAGTFEDVCLGSWRGLV